MILHITDVNRQDIRFQFKQANVPLIYTTDRCGVFFDLLLADNNHQLF